MPELPDVTVYVECLAARCMGEILERVRIAGPSLLRSVDPPISAAEGKLVLGVRRLGKRIAFELEGDLFLIFHLMIAGRFRWRERGARAAGKIALASFEFTSGALILTEASAHKRATLHLVRGDDALAEHDPGGLEVLEAPFEAFQERMLRENRTLKRALTDPHILSGIGNAYSDEILHRARLSPVTLTSRLTDEEWRRLYSAVRETLEVWTARLREQTGDGFPEKVTAFRPEMAVHGRYRKPCPECGAPVQRIVYAANETNYCARCQTGGRLLADRALSQLLKKDWPRSLEELEALRAPR
ncbi:MAG TPA: DNA-formamidopyrimidine glycosylase family protein [Myxococcota bacterium]|nr:DNA-formamidopyrimidine glycosylase family protein [Myxococcota bacterium]